MTERYFVWKINESYLEKYGSIPDSDVKSKEILAGCFDMDHTLICPKDGKTFPKSRDDIMWWNPKIPAILKELYKMGYHIVLFTNQSGIQRGKVKLEDVEWRVNWVQENAGIPISYYIAPYINKYRKPIPGMWNHFCKSVGMKVNYERSFYCGDACGRLGDYTQGDYLFALNCGLPFKTPEELIGDKSDPAKITPNTSYIDFAKVHNFLRYPMKYPEPKTPATKSMIIMRGAPASGKSTYAYGIRHQSPFWEQAVIVSNDLMTKGQISKKMEEAVKLSSPIIVDNTHSTAKQRAPFFEFAKTNGYNVILVDVNTCMQVAMHLNVWRMYTQDKPLIPFVAFATWRKNKEDITEKEAEQLSETIEYLPELPDEVLKFRANGFYKEVKCLEKI